MSLLSRVNRESVQSALKGLSERLNAQAIRDAIYNSVTGIGSDRSKAAYNEWVDAPPLTMDELEMLFANNDLANVIVSKLVEDSLRDGFSLSRGDSDPEQDEDLVGHVMRRWRELQAGESRFQRGAVWGRLFGGGGLLLIVKGAGPLGSRLDDTKVTEVVELRDVTRDELKAYTWYPDGRVETYWYTPEMAGPSYVGSIIVHETRFLAFPGAVTTRSRRRENEGWDLSVLQKVVEVLRSFDTMWANTDAMFADASQAVFHMQGLIASLAEDGGGSTTGVNDVKTRLSLMDMGRSVAKAIILDSGGENGEGREDFKVVDRASLGGLDAVQQNYMVRLATAARMPLTVLLGQSPAGMDATGEGDMILYYNTVDLYRKEVLECRLLRVLKMLLQEQYLVEAAEGESDDPKSELDVNEWCIEWPELSRPKPLDVQTAENMRVTNAMALATGQVLTPEEVALNLRRIAPSLGIRIDLEPRRKALEAAMSEVENRELGMAAKEAEAELATSQEVKVAQATPSAAPAEKKSERKTPSKAAGKQV